MTISEGQVLQMKYANDSGNAWQIYEVNRFNSRQHFLNNQRLWKPEAQANHSPVSGLFLQLGARRDHDDVSA